MKVVVVGASSGLGRCIGIGLAQRGDQVALLARRRERLDDAAKEAGPGTLAIPCDVTDEVGCRAAVEEAAAGLGGIDGLVYTPAVATLSRLEDTSADIWRRTLETNVVGASLVTAAALPFLRQSHGVAAFLSSIVGTVTQPLPGLGAYMASKAALERLIEAWRGEHPDVGFTRITVGNCAGGEGDSLTEFTSGWDSELSRELGELWFAKSLLDPWLLDVDDLTRVVAMVLGSGASSVIPWVMVTARPGQ
jgi:NAD(P)-dependent dehydrogenase (short-subunit alcohol dehydrogenase family)